MRRLRSVLAAAGCVALVAVAVQPGAASAAPSPSGSGAPAASGGGQTVCNITDRNLLEISGLAAVDNGYLAVNDSAQDQSTMRIYRLVNEC